MRVPWLADVLRGAGLTVIETSGWKGRGRDLTGVSGVIWHHTATGPGTSDAAVDSLLINGRQDLPGPLCQLGLDRGGRFHVIADGKGNHNGYGTWGNNSIGIEAFNSGVGEPWPSGQVDAYVAGTRAILTHLGLPLDRMLGHKESDPGRKIDPAGLDMNDMRRRVAEGDDMPLTADDHFAIQTYVRQIVKDELDAAVKRLAAHDTATDKSVKKAVLEALAEGNGG